MAAQSVAAESATEIADETAALEAVVGRLGPDVCPPARSAEYDRSATRRLEGEAQELLEAIAADPDSREERCEAIFERKLLLQHLTGLDT